VNQLVEILGKLHAVGSACTGQPTRRTLAARAASEARLHKTFMINLERA
jgi:hypothetical protein